MFKNLNLMSESNLKFMEKNSVFSSKPLKSSIKHKK